MKIVRYQKNNKISYGVINKNTIIPVTGDIFEKYELSEQSLKREDVKLLAPVNPPNIIAIGLNYKKHADESKLSYPDRPLIFLKATSSLIGPEDKIILPELAPNEVDYEAELVIVIGKEAKNIEIEDVPKYVLGYTCGNDVSARDCQI